MNNARILRKESFTQSGRGKGEAIHYVSHFMPMQSAICKPIHQNAIGDLSITHRNHLKITIIGSRNWGNEIFRVVGKKLKDFSKLVATNQGLKISIRTLWQDERKIMISLK